MLREVHKSSQGGGSFYDHLSSATFSLKGSAIIMHHPKNPPQKLAIPFNSAPSIHSPTEYLPRLVKVYGPMLVNSEGTFVSSCSGDECMARVSRNVTDYMCWQFYFPVSLYGVEMGLFTEEPNGIRNQVSFEFISSTSRTVTFMARHGKIYAWVNKSKPNKNHQKTLNYQHQKWYPYIKIKSQGSTAVFNPFATQPHTQITHLNPFNSHQCSKPTLQNKPDLFQSSQPQITHIFQLNNHKMLLKTKNHHYKVIQRDQHTNKFIFPTTQVNNNTIKGLWSHAQFQRVKQFCKGVEGEMFQFSDGYLDINYAFQHLKYLIQLVDKNYSIQHQQIMYILLSKLQIIRPYVDVGKVPNPIYVSQLDHQNSHYSKIFFQDVPVGFRLSSQNENPWTKIEGKLGDLTENYMCFMGDDQTVDVYHVQHQIKKVFTHKIDHKFDKDSFLQNFSEKELRPFKENSSAPHVFKILSNCLQEVKDQQLLAYEPKKKDLLELVNDYKVPEEQAEIALKQCKNVQQAMVWLSDPNKKVTRSSPSQKDKVQPENKEVKKNISFLQLKSNPFVRGILQIERQIYLIGLSPRDIASCIQKTQRGIMNLSTFTHQSELLQLNHQNWYSSLNHQQLTIVDGCTVPSQFSDIFSIFRQNDSFMLAYDMEGIPMKVKINLYEDKTYNPKQSISVGVEPLPLTEQYVDYEQIERSVNGYLVYEQNIKTQKICHEISVTLNGIIYSNIESNVQKVVQMIVELDAVPAFNLDDQKQSGYLPLLVEKGPPGCNLNYPICSILYPKNPFLANYPYSLTLRNLHQKLMKVKEVVIQRIGNRKNVNQVKEGYIYFQNQSGMRSKKEKFVFDGQDNLVVKIDEQNYWEYLIIDPIYATGKKMPYQIGFVGAKGVTIDRQNYNKSLLKHVEYSLTINGNRKYQILSYHPVGNSSIKLEVIVDEDVDEITIEGGMKILQTTTKSTQKVLSENKLKRINELPPNEFFKVLAKHRDDQLEVLKKIEGDDTFSLSAFSQIQIRQFCDIVHFQPNMKQSTYEKLMAKMMKNPHTEKYLNQMKDTVDCIGISYNFLSPFLNNFTPEDLLTAINKILTLIQKLQKPEYEPIKEEKVPHLLLEQYLYSSFYFDRINSLLGSASTCEPIYESDCLNNIEVVSMKEQFLRKLIVKLDSQHIINNILLRVDRSEMHLKSVVNVYAYSSAKKEKISTNYIQQHQWIQIMKNPYNQEMSQMFKHNKGWLNGYGISLEGKNVKAHYLQIQILFTVSGVVGEKRQSENIPFVDVVPEIYGSKLKTKSPNPQLESLFTMKEEEKFFLSNVSISNNSLNKYLVSKNNNTEYHYYQGENESALEIRKTIAEKVKNKQYKTAISLQSKLIHKYKWFAPFSPKVGLDYAFTFLIIALEKMNHQVPAEVGKRLVEVIIKKEIGPIQQTALKCVCPHIQSLIEGLPYISNRIPSISKLALTPSDISNVLKHKNPQLAASLTKLITHNLPPTKQTVSHTIALTIATHNHIPVLEYLLKAQNPTQLFTHESILTYLTTKVNGKLLDQHFVDKLGEKQLQIFIMKCKSQGISTVDFKSLLDRLLNMESLEAISLDLVPLLFENKDAHWNNLNKCIKLCPPAEDMIYSQYLSYNRDQPEQILELVTFHKEILHSAAKSPKNAQLFAAFMSELFFVDRDVFIDVVLGLPKDVSLHEDIYETIMVILSKECMVGGIEGAKMATYSQNRWMTTVLKLLKLSPKLKASNQEILIRWYLANNDYELIPTNPVNRSNAVNDVKEVAELVKDLLTSNQLSISSILAIYNQMKEKIKTSTSKLLSAKHLQLHRLQYGVEKLVTKNVDSNELTEVLIGGQGILKEIVSELESEIKGEGSAKWENFKEIQLTDDMEGHCLQGQKMQNLNVKDWQSYKTGSKSVTCKVGLAAKKLLLKPKSPLNMSKIAVGFCVQDNVEKNIFLPESVELYGGSSENSMMKVCTLECIEDQHFYPFGVKVFVFNFNKLNKKSRNGLFNSLELRMNINSFPSCSDVLENYQKSLKNGVFHVSFISITGHEQQPTSQPSYTSIYMKLLSLLSLPQHQSTLKSITIQNKKAFEPIFPKLISVLSHGSWDKKNKKLIENLFIALSNVGQNVLQQLIRQPECNNSLIKVILNNNKSSENLDTVLAHTIQNNLNQQTAHDMVQAIKIASYGKVKPSPSKKYTQETLPPLIHKSKDHQILTQILACILSTPLIYPVDHKKIIQEIMTQRDRSSYYPLIASFVYSNEKCLEWFLNEGKTNEVNAQLLRKMCENSSSAKVVNDVFQEIYLISTLVTSFSIKEKLIQTRFPLQVLEQLKSSTTLLIQYPKLTMKYFISLFQSTCIESECAEEFASELINLMVKLPQIPSTYHQFFIHEFFFPLINAYTGAPVAFIWKGVNNAPLTKVTQSLDQLPIRSNDKIIQHHYQYFRPIDQGWNDEDEIVVKKQDEVVAERVKGKWSSKQLKVEGSAQEGKLIINGETVSMKDNQEYKTYIKSDRDKTLLTNQTLLKIKKPTLFGKNYLSELPANVSIFDQLYLLPLEMSLENVLRQFNICGYHISQTSIKDIIVLNKVTGKPFSLETKIGDIYRQSKNPFIELEIFAHSIFKDATIQKIAKNEEEAVPAFIPQETVFKSFEKLKGLQKMIKVLITCVKNWSNQEQSKIWLQYLNQLESFSCFPVFSSIYMTKQSNVQLLFDLLSGLPDKEEPKKWTEEEKKSVRFLYDIIKNVFEVEGEQAIIIRNYAIQSGFYQTMLERLHLVTKEPKRYKAEESEEEEEEINLPELAKKDSQEEYKQKVKKKKGIGYGTDSSSNQKWDIAGHEQARKEQSNQILGLLKILEKFLSHPKFSLPKELLEASFSSCLLPVLEASLRGGSLLQISKYAQLFTGELSFIKAIAKNSVLIPCLMEIPKEYEPKQSQSINSLLKTLEGTSKIFLSCLTGSVSEKTSEQIAKNIIETYEKVDEAISKYKSDNIDEDQERRILELPLAKKYPLLMKDLRFDYVDMKDKNGKVKHHYSSSYTAKHTSPATKTIRLAQELADISHALPIDHTNAIFVRCDKERVDFMQALIMGSNGTPYGHGAYLFDIHFEDSYPNNPPKVNLTTTGSGSIRFNPNLYNCGKVCLSLLGTWRGSAMENWDSKVSTLLQVLVSIQSIIMSQEVYFNEPGFQHEQGTVEGEKKNEAYSNVVRYGNIKFAMLQNLKNPPKGFETVIRRHFYLKKQEILTECRKWQKYAEKRQASYSGLVSDHNHNWCSTFNKSKKQYSTMLSKAISELQQELNKLPEPSSKDLIKKNEPEKKEKVKRVKVEEKDEVQQEIDVTYEQNKVSNFKQLDINDEKVKDRWSRYIGAMGIQAVSKQSKANILLFGLDSLGIEIAKNLVLSGCRKLAISERESTNWNDLAGQFYLSEDDIGKNRVQACLYKLQQLNNYVRVEAVSVTEQTIEQIKQYHLVIATGHSNKQLFKLNSYCKENGIKLIVVQAKGPYGYVFNDFGQNFEVTDKNGEETVEVMIESISNEQNGVVTLLNGQRHSYEDGQAIRISQIKGMTKENGQSINGSIHKIKVINQFSFSIGDTTQYSAYEGNGLARNMKLPITVSFKSFEDTSKQPNVDDNLLYYDWTKSTNNKLLSLCFNALDQYVGNHSKSPRPWSWEDSELFAQLVKGLKGQPLEQNQIKYVKKFSFTCSGTFAPLCAFYGGLIAQEAFKAITSKYMPINQYFFTQFTETIATLPKELNEWKEFVENMNYKPQQNRFEGLRTIVGDESLKKIRDCRVFVIGSGAIGCQLLKNYAMISLATGDQKGEIIVTDPDHIETSNLNRQFLFRQKHLQKPKSMTAAAAAKQMNKFLKNKIKAKLTKVCEATKDTFSNEFFQSLDIVTNALDNVQARQYVDLRCVQNKIALLESGTLSSKGHVQVIVPYKTQTYGSKADPAEQGDIPHCTLKMFPEEALHCVEWARDIFGKTFTLKPKALMKIIQSMDSYSPNSSQVEVLKDSLKMLEDRPKNFDDAIYIATQQFYRLYRNDIKQLLYTYPLDAKTKDGKPFWKLPKRPPTPIQQIDPSKELHGQFIASYAVLLSKINGVPYPNDFRTKQRREEIANQAAKIKVDPFVPSDKLAKEMESEVDKEDKEQVMEEKVQEQPKLDQNEVTLFKEIKLIVDEEVEIGNEVKIVPEEFEKDEDTNGHIDLIYSMAHLRVQNYKLQPMDWITTKLKAGRITPALSTTTSCIAALQTIELIKYLKGCTVEEMRNSFINLAVPIVQTGEPGQVEKIKIHDDLTTNIWERWQIGPVDFKTVTMSELIASIEEKYKIKVKVLNILSGGPIFSDLVLGLESKKGEKEAFMKRKFCDVINEEGSLDQVKKFIDLTILIGSGEEIVKHVPTIRVSLH